MNARKILPTVGMLAASLVVFSACSTGANEEPTEATETTAEESMESDGGGMAEEDGMASDGGGMASDGGGMDDPAANLIGAGCADYAEAVPDGPGSVAGMAEDPVSVAASNNPLLTTLVKAVAGELNPDVNLVDTLDGGEFTVFAPVDDAFGAIPEEDLNALASDPDALEGVLTYHVVPGQITPDELADTTQTTVQGEDVEVTGSGDEMMVNGATVICGGVQTQNATVYLVDTVLMPPSMAEQG